MKKIFFIFILICIANKGYAADKSKIANGCNENISTPQDNDSIIGCWTIYKTILIETNHKNKVTTTIKKEIACNICPSIIFEKVGKGKLKNSSGNESLFYWRIDQSEIYFSFDKKQDKDMFFSAFQVFRFRLYKESKSYILELTETSGNCKYILMR